MSEFIAIAVMVAVPGGLLLGGVVGLSVAGMARFRALRSEERRLLGASVGLDHSLGRLNGQWHGRSVWVFFANLMIKGRNVEAWEVAVPLKAALGDVTIERGCFERTFGRGQLRHKTLPDVVITGSKSMAGALLADSALVALLGRAPHNVEIESGVVRLRLPARGSLKSVVDTAVALALGVEAAANAPWLRIAEHFGLQVRGPNDIAGEVAGRGVGVVCGRYKGELVTEIRARFSPRLVDGSIRAGSGGVELLDPILGGKVAATGDAGARLQGRVDDDLRSSLLEVLVQFPKSEVIGDAVIVRIPGRAMGELGGAIYAATVIADRLSS